jgi:hypothetical protein
MTQSTRSTNEPIPDYLAYLLRLWRTRGDRADGWRASLTYPGSGERHGFASLDDLFLFLQQQTDAGSDAQDAQNKTQ